MAQTPTTPQILTDLSTFGRTGLKAWGGYVYDEWHPRLRGALATRVYTEMRDNDAVVGAILYAIESLIRQVKWRVEPAGEDEQSRVAAQFLEECVQDMSHTWEDFIAEVLSMLPFGWSYFETTYKIRAGDHESPELRSRYSDGRIGWRKLEIRAQDTLYRWEIDEQDGSLRGMWQLAPPLYDPTFLPIEKCLLFRTKAVRGNPEGRSMLRNAYRSWFFLKRIQEIEAIGVERDLAGLPVMQVPLEIMLPTATAGQQAIRSHFETLIQQIRRDEREGVVMPSELDAEGKPTGYKLSLLSSGGRRPMDVDTIVKRYESRIAMSVLAEFILLGMDAVGAFALADSKTSMFASALGGVLDSIGSTVNRFGVARLFKLNPEFPEECWPKLVHGDIETPDLAALSAYVNGLVGTGVLQPDAKLERYLRDAAKLPQRDEETADAGLAALEAEFAAAAAAAEAKPSVTAAPVSAPSAEAAPQVADTSLNGAQIAGMLAILEQVSSGLINSDAATALISTAFPTISREAATQIVAGTNRKPLTEPVA